MKTAAEIRKILNALAAAERGDNDEKEIIYDRELEKLRSLDREGILDAIAQAIGDNPKRKKASAAVYAEFYDVPGVETVFLELLKSSDSDVRNWIIQTIGSRNLRSFVDVLNARYYVERDDFCLDQLIFTLGKFADDSSLPVFLDLIRQNDSSKRWRILAAMTSFSRSEFAEYLLESFKVADKSKKVWAAWALVKQGYREYYQYLIDMLADPEIRTVNSYDPGESPRAAQAIADINGWEFEWNRASVDLIKSKIAEEEGKLSR